MNRAVINLSFLLGILFTTIGTSKAETKATPKNINGHQVVCCDVSDISNTIDLELSDIVDNCEMVKLETTSKSILGNIHYACVSENYIAINTYDRPQLPVKLFKRDGTYLRDIGAIGKGPGEYTSIYGTQIDENANRIYITPFANAQHILVYDLEGNQLPEIKLVYKQTKCRVFIEDGIVTVMSMPFNDQIPVAYQQTIGGKLIKELPRIPHLIQRPDFSHEISSDHNTNAFEYFVLPWGSEKPDTLYHYNIKSNQLDPKFVVTDGKSKVGSWYREYPKHYIAYLFGDKYNGKKAVVEKSTLNANFFNLYNDYYGGISLEKFFMSQGGIFTASMSTEELMEKLDKALESGDLTVANKSKLSSIRKSLDINDNSVLFIGKMSVN